MESRNYNHPSVRRLRHARFHDFSGFPHNFHEHGRKVPLIKEGPEIPKKTFDALAIYMTSFL